ncbi:MAG: 50S ribosomal protein L29 [Lentisphaerae bacterium]|nr:50S ribosomal protein L29 [Lentisphaerota bacterium]
MKPREFRELSAEELAVKVRESAHELAGLRLKHRSGVAVEKAGRMRQMRRDIARMLTIAAEREKQA